MPIRIADQSFKTKAAAIKYQEAILNSYPIGSPLNENHYQFVVAALMMREPETIKDKLGNGPDPKILRISPMYIRGCRAKTFCLHRSDGTITDFSFKKAITPSNMVSDAKKAARWEVREHTEWYKEAYFTGKCELTGEPIDIKTCHVDHMPPHQFDVLFAEFLKSEGLRIQDVETRNVGDFQMGRIFVDRELAARWYSYHLENAVLRIISPKANLSLVKKVPGDYPCR